MSFLLESPALGFLHVPLHPRELWPSWAPAVLGLFHVEVVSARLNPGHGTINVRRVYAPRFCLVTTKIWSDGY